MNKVQKNFHLLVSFLSSYSTYDLGSLQETCRTLLFDSNFDNYTYISDSIKQILTQISNELDNNSQLKGKRIELYTLIIIDSLIFNLYSKHKTAKK